MNVGIQTLLGWGLFFSFVGSTKLQLQLADTVGGEVQCGNNNNRETIYNQNIKNQNNQ